MNLTLSKESIRDGLEPIHVFKDAHKGRHCGYKWIAVTEKSSTEEIPEGALVSIFDQVVFTSPLEAKSFWLEHINDKWLGLGESRGHAIEALVDRNNTAV